MSAIKHARGWLAMAAALAAGPAMAGEFEIDVRLGRNWLKVDGSRLTSGNDINDRHLVNLGLAASYQWPRGGFVEVGLAGTGSFDILGIEHLSHRWIGGGWRFDLGSTWKITPKAGLTYSRLTSSEENVFATEPVDELGTTAPFAELTIEKRFFEHLGLGLYLRHTFEDWGSTDDRGLLLTWTF